MAPGVVGPRGIWNCLVVAGVEAGFAYLREPEISGLVLDVERPGSWAVGGVRINCNGVVSALQCLFEESEVPFI